MADEREPRIEIHVHIDSPEAIVETVRVLGRMASRPVEIQAYAGEEQLGLFEIDFRVDSGSEVVTPTTFQRYYFESFGAERASNFPAVLFGRAAELAGEESVTTDAKGNITGIKRYAFDILMERMTREKIAGLTGPKSRRFLQGLSASLPPAYDKSGGA